MGHRRTPPVDHPALLAASSRSPRRSHRRPAGSAGWAPSSTTMPLSLIFLKLLEGASTVGGRASPPAHHQRQRPPPASARCALALSARLPRFTSQGSPRCTAASSPFSCCTQHHQTSTAHRELRSRPRVYLLGVGGQANSRIRGRRSPPRRARAFRADPERHKMGKLALPGKHLRLDLSIATMAVLHTLHTSTLVASWEGLSLHFLPAGHHHQRKGPGSLLHLAHAAPWPPNTASHRARPRWRMRSHEHASSLSNWISPWGAP